jgi:hypothetical protein
VDVGVGQVAGQLEPTLVAVAEAGCDAASGDLALNAGCNARVGKGLVIAEQAVAAGKLGADASLNLDEAADVEPWPSAGHAHRRLGTLFLGRSDAARLRAHRLAGIGIFDRRRLIAFRLRPRRASGTDRRGDKQKSLRNEAHH